MHHMGPLIFRSICNQSASFLVVIKAGNNCQFFVGQQDTCLALCPGNLDLPGSRKPLLPTDWLFLSHVTSSIGSQPRPNHCVIKWKRICAHPGEGRALPVYHQTKSHLTKSKKRSSNNLICFSSFSPRALITGVVTQ